MATAAVTMVSKNYLAAARVLATSFLANNPGSRFFVYLADEVDGYFDPEQEPFELLEFDDVLLPASDSFRYHYTILELNTAVKPFVLAHLFEKYGFEKLCYIDPDVVIYRELEEVWSALDDHDVVLTPHMRTPYFDAYHPTEVQIVQSGTYNLGFIGLRHSQDVDALLEWWMEKLYLECIVDIPNGLFVDQKWANLIPGYVESTWILRDPSYNVAYWNLHDRRVESKDADYLVDGKPLAFFHFSGYSPQLPDKLSKHQDRHDLKDLPVVARLCEDYGKRLRQCDFDKVRKWPFAFSTLTNGVEVSRCVHWVLRHCLSRDIEFPSPLKDPDGFCRFLMTPTMKMPGGTIPPMAVGLLHCRPDVAQHFPEASSIHPDPGLREWVRHNGVEEENLGGLVEDFWEYWEEKPLTRRIISILDRRADVRKVFAEICSNPDDFEGFLSWCRSYGVDEEGLDPEELDGLERLGDSYYRVLSIYFKRSDLQKEFATIHDSESRKNFVQWLVEHLDELPTIDEADVHWFTHVADACEADLLFANLLYNTYIRGQVGCDLSLFTLDRFSPYIDDRAREELVSLLVSGETLTHLQQLESAFVGDKVLKRTYPRAFDVPSQTHGLVDDLAERARGRYGDDADEWLRDIHDHVATFDHSEYKVTVVGYFDSPTGMGESSRSVYRIIEKLGVRCQALSIPEPFVSDGSGLAKDSFAMPFGWSQAGTNALILVSNADACEEALEFLPVTVLGADRRIGYWAWETEDLPKSRGERSRFFDELWTLSQYSANAIVPWSKVPVEVIPPSFEAARYADIEPARDKFGIDPDAFAIGYLFDPRSAMQRKNPRGLVAAFEEAFEGRQDVQLVLKINSEFIGSFEYRYLRAQLDADPRILIIEKTISSTERLELIKSLDCYVSPHRSEGFGLTIAEALLLGVPVVSSAYSGAADILEGLDYLPIRADRAVLERNFGAYKAGQFWSEPRHEDIVAGLREAESGRYKPDLAGARKSLLNRFSTERVAELARERLGL